MNYSKDMKMDCQDKRELEQYRAIGTVEQLQELKEKLQGYKNQMSIYAEQHKIILAIDVLDMLEEIDWQ